MAGRGRPKKADKDKKSFKLLVRFTEEERKELEMAANNHGYWSMAAFIRDLVYESMKEEGKYDGST